MEEVKVVELLPNGLTKVELGNDKPQGAEMGRMLNDLALRLGCNCERCQKRRAAN